MDPVEQARTNVVGQLPDLAQQVGRACGDQGGDECGGAVPAVKSHGGGGLVVGRGGEVRTSPAVQVCVDEPRHHRHRAEFAIRGPGRIARADRIDHALGHLNPAGPQQFSAREDGVGGQQHCPSDALPFRLGAVGLAVVVDELKPAGGGVVEQHRDVRVMLQDGRRP